MLPPPASPGSAGSAHPPRATSGSAPGGLATVRLEAPDGARAEIARHGAHVLSWRPAGPAAGDPLGGERLFLSERSGWQAGVAIRGGIPVIFPQFADRGPLPKHGLARTRDWTLVPEGTGEDGDAARALFRLTDTPETRARWPHAFAAELSVRVAGRTLDVALAVENRGPAPLAFTGALHTYLRVGDLAAVELHGLQGITYQDATDGGRERIEREPAVVFRGELDRAYLDVRSPLALLEAGRHLLTVDAIGFPDVVVWNPGPEKAAALADLEPGGHARMLCVEAAAVAVPVELAPGEHWTGVQTLTAVGTR